MPGRIPHCTFSDQSSLSGTSRLAALLMLPSLAFAGPRLEVTPQKHDFGKVFQGATVEHSFRVKNVGDALLKIERIRGSCALCATSMLKATTLGPGEGDRLVVSYHAKGKLGPRTAFLMIHSNDPVTPFAKIGLSVTVVSALGQPRISANPAKHSLGDVPLSRKRVARIVLTNAKDAKVDLAIREIQCSPGCRVLEPSPVAIQPGSSAVLSVRVLPARPGELAESVTVASSDPVTPLLAIPITGRVVQAAGESVAVRGTPNNRVAAGGKTVHRVPLVVRGTDALQTHEGVVYGGVRARPLGDLVLLPGAGGKFVLKLMIENELDRKVVVVFPPDGTSLGRARPAQVSLAPGHSAAVDIEAVPDQVGKSRTIRMDVCPLWIGKMKRKDAEARRRKGR